MVNPLDWMGSVLVMHFCWFHMCFSYLWCMCLLRPCCVGHGGDGVTMEVLMVLLSTCCHECMTSYVLFLLMYCLCMLAYMLLHVVYELLVYARPHIVHACVFSMYDFLCDVICGTCIGRSRLVMHIKWVHMV